MGVNRKQKIGQKDKQNELFDSEIGLGFFQDHYGLNPGSLVIIRFYGQI